MMNKKLLVTPFGSTFDPLDILAYGCGVGVGVFLDLYLFPRTIEGWMIDS